MKQTYQEFLEESTNTVKAKRRLEKKILFSTYLLVWTIVMVIFWQAKGSMTFEYTKLIEESGYAMYTFRFPNFGYMPIGIVVAACGICVGSFCNKKIKKLKIDFTEGSCKKLP